MDRIEDKWAPSDSYLEHQKLDRNDTSINSRVLIDNMKDSNVKVSGDLSKYSDSNQSGDLSKHNDLNHSEGLYLEDIGDIGTTLLPSQITLCNVCGDIAAGFHCGAYVCEACKKFFVRCLKHDNGLKFACANDRQCEITKETRTQCPDCRYQKCLSLGMYRPGGPNVSDDICHIPCKVCGAPSSGFHFGAITFEGCKGFFRRTVKERGSVKYTCSRERQCVVTWKTRNACKFCRYQRCLDAGMMADKSRIGRQPNSVKHATMLQLQYIKAAKGLIEPFDMAAVPASGQTMAGLSEIQCLPKVELISDDEDVEDNDESFSRSNVVLSASGSRIVDEDLAAVELLYSGVQNCHRNEVSPGQNRSRDEISSDQNCFRIEINPVQNRFRDEVILAQYCSRNEVSPIQSGFRNDVISNHFSSSRKHKSSDVQYESKPLADDYGKRRGSLLDVPNNTTPHMTSTMNTIHRTPGHQLLSVDTAIHDMGSANSDSSAYTGYREEPNQIKCSSQQNLNPLALSYDSTRDLSRFDARYSSEHSNAKARQTDLELREQSDIPFDLAGAVQRCNFVETSDQSHINGHSLNVNSRNDKYINNNIDDRYLENFSAHYGVLQHNHAALLNVSQTDNYSRSSPQERNFQNPGVTSYSKDVDVCVDSELETQYNTIQYNTDVMSNSSRREEKLSEREEKLSERHESPTTTTLSDSIPLMEYHVVINIMNRAYEHLRSINIRGETVVPIIHNMTQNELWESMMSSFATHAGTSLKFAKRVPGFKSFTLGEQIEIVQACLFPIVLVVLSRCYDIHTKSFNWFNYTPEEHKIILSKFEPFGLLVPWFHKIGTILHELDADDTEISFLCGLSLMNAGNKSEYKELLLDALNEYCSCKYRRMHAKEDDDESISRDACDDYAAEARYRSGRILMCLRDMSDADIAHQQAIGQLLSDPKYHSIEFPQLFKESFIGMDD